MGSIQELLTAASQPMVTIEVKGQQFHVHENLLVKNSQYFRARLSMTTPTDTTEQNATRLLKFDDVEPAVMGQYVSLIYTQYNNPGYKIIEGTPPNKANLEADVALWHLCDRFSPKELRPLLDHLVTEHLKALTIVTQIGADVKRVLSCPNNNHVEPSESAAMVQKIYNTTAKDGSKPFKQLAVREFCKNCKKDAFQLCSSILSPSFVLDIATEWAPAHNELAEHVKKPRGPSRAEMPGFKMGHMTG